MKNIIFIILVSILVFSCTKKMGCPNDQFNNWKKIQETTKQMNSNKTKKQKGSSSNDMGPSTTTSKKKK